MQVTLCLPFNELRILSINFDNAILIILYKRER